MRGDDRKITEPTFYEIALAFVSVPFRPLGWGLGAVRRALRACGRSYKRVARDEAHRLARRRLDRECARLERGNRTLRAVERLEREEG